MSRGRGRATVAASCGRAGGAHSFPCDRRVQELLARERDLASRVQEHAERRDREEQAVEDHNLRRVSEASEVLRRVCAALLCEAGLRAGAPRLRVVHDPEEPLRLRSHRVQPVHILLLGRQRRQRRSHPTHDGRSHFSSTFVVWRGYSAAQNLNES